MSKPITNSIKLALVFTLFTFSKCKKDTTDSFCTISRVTTSAINSQTGVVIYYQKYTKYGIRLNIAISGNIDTQIIGLACDIPKELQAEGTNVKVTGQLKKFNSDENISPQMPGDDLYYLEITQIIKQ